MHHSHVWFELEANISRTLGSVKMEKSEKPREACVVASNLGLLGRSQRLWRCAGRSPLGGLLRFLRSQSNARAVVRRPNEFNAGGLKGGFDVE